MIKWIFISALALVAAAVIAFKYGNTRPSDLGVKDKRLLVCPTSPNCVSSQAEKNDQRHYIEPINYSVTRVEALRLLKEYLLSQRRVEVITVESSYIYVEAKSKTVGFIDDVEFYLPELDGVIHIRSASRVGYSDRGVNRARIEKVRKDLVALVR